MSSPGEDDANVPVKKRKSNPSAYKRNIIKKCNVKGEEHVNGRVHS